MWKRLSLLCRELSKRGIKHRSSNDSDGHVWLEPDTWDHFGVLWGITVSSVYLLAGLRGGRAGPTPGRASCRGVATGIGQRGASAWFSFSVPKIVSDTLAASGFVEVHLHRHDARVGCGSLQATANVSRGSAPLRRPVRTGASRFGGGRSAAHCAERSRWSRWPAGARPR